MLSEKDGEGDKKEVKGWKGRGKDLPDQCQTASYAPELGTSLNPTVETFTPILVFLCHFVIELGTRMGQTDRQTDGRSRSTMLLLPIGWPYSNNEIETDFTKHLNEQINYHT